MIDWKTPSSFLQNKGNTAGAQSMGRKFLKGNMAFLPIDTAMNMASGDDVGTAILKGGASAALWTTAPLVMGAYTAATTLPQAASSLYVSHRNQVQWWNNQHVQGMVGGNYMDTQRALTMRQAAVKQIESSKMNARSSLGGEAKILSQTFIRQ